MKSYKLIALFIWRASAAPQNIKPTAAVLPEDVAVNAGIDPALVGKPIFEIIPDNASPGSQGVSKRQIPTQPSVVYRVDSMPPDAVKAQGGFPPREADLGKANFAIYGHSHNTLSGKDSPYVSTSVRPDGAEIFASPGKTSYLYEIKTTPNMIDTFSTLGGNKMTSKGEPYLLHKAEREVLALGGVKWDQVQSVTALPNGRDTNKSERKKVTNKDYNPKYNEFKAGGTQHQLAGFPPGHEAWTTSPWNQFKDADIRESGLQFADANGAAIEDERPQKTSPGKDGDESHPNAVPNGEKKRPLGERIQESRFLQFLADLDPAFLEPLINGIKAGDFSVEDLQLGFKRAVSVTMTKRWADFGDGDKAAESLKNIAFDIFSTFRYATPVGYWEDVIKNLPAIAKEIHEGKTPEEKLEIANRDINDVVKTWSKTPLGLVNEALMKVLSGYAPPVQTAVSTLNKIWSYTPFGWLVNQFAPIDSLIEKNIQVRSDEI
ncbi:hypothetical protein G3M48_000564 [Beauveria asiatica]|uniref:Cholera enterotoxin subunit A2 n=1 Tax=Beauveria asiatica TaxID=1069075 RepID=A0AAW0S173_9HYPO